MYSARHREETVQMLLSCCCCSCCIFIVPFLGCFFFFFVHNGVNFVIVDKCLETLLPSLHSFWFLGISVHIDVIEGKLDPPPPSHSSPFLFQQRDHQFLFRHFLPFLIEVPHCWTSSRYKQVVLVAENCNFSTYVKRAAKYTAVFSVNTTVAHAASCEHK